MHARSRRRDPEGRAEPIGISRFAQQRLRLRRIVGVPFDLLGERPRDRRRNRAGRRRARALEHIPADRLFVDRVVRRLPHAGVVERLLLGVERHPPDVRARLLVHLEPLVILELGEVVGRHIDDEIHAAGEQFGHPGLLLDQGTKHQPVQFGRAVPVRRVFIQDDADALLPTHELEGPGTHRVARKLFTPLLDRSGTHDPSGVQGQVVEERGERLLEHEPHGERIHDSGLFDRAIVERGEWERPGMMVRVCGVEQPIVHELDRGRVDGGPVVKRHVLPQFERVDEPVRRNVPRCGETGLEVESPRREPH